MLFFCRASMIFSLLFTNLQRGFLAGTSYTSMATVTRTILSGQPLGCVLGNGLHIKMATHLAVAVRRLRHYPSPLHRLCIPKAGLRFHHRRRHRRGAVITQIAARLRSHRLHRLEFNLRFPSRQSFGQSTRAPHLFSRNLHRLLPYHHHDHLLPCLPPRP